MNIRPAIRSDTAAWLALRQELWPDPSQAEHLADINGFFDGSVHEPLHVLLAVDATGAVMGFAEVSIRAYAEGCETDRVAYLEGWYVIPDARRQGIGESLIRVSEDWGRAQGCTEFASDTELENATGTAAHLALGFVETARIRCFKKSI